MIFGIPIDCILVSIVGCWPASACSILATTSGVKCLRSCHISTRLFSLEICFGHFWNAAADATRLGSASCQSVAKLPLPCLVWTWYRTSLRINSTCNLLLLQLGFASESVCDFERAVKYFARAVERPCEGATCCTIHALQFCDEGRHK